MTISKVLSILILATLITLIYLFLYITARIFLWSGLSISSEHVIHNVRSDEYPLYKGKGRGFSNRKEIEGFKLRICSADTTSALTSPRLSNDEYDWCLWAKNSSGGNVSPYTMWGNLKTKQERMRYHFLNCEELHRRQDSCNDVEGDGRIRNWRQSRLSNDRLTCDAEKSSRQVCYQYNSDTYCELNNVMIDFRKFQNGTRVNRFGETLNLRVFEPDFMTSDCASDANRSSKSLLDLPYNQFYSPVKSSQKCDVTLTDPVLLISHDYLENFGHTINDIMNVWQMLWLSGLAATSRSNVDLLSIDGLYGSRSYNDQPSPWFLHYRQFFRRVLTPRDYVNQSMCFKRLILQPIPNTFFVFKYWHADDKCNLQIGPSSLFQRYNLHVRGLLAASSNSGSGEIRTNKSNTVSFSEHQPDDVFRVVVLVRKEKNNLADTSSKTSRLILNLDQVQTALNGVVPDIQRELGNCKEVDILFQDFSEISYREQLHLIGRTNLLVGMHGAGIPQSLHMSIGGGRDNCCGVIEMFPAGEFSIIRAHGNMARRMGLKYDRIDIAANESYAHGAVVPVDVLSAKVVAMASLMHREPSCILSTVLEDPYLLK